MPDRCSPADLNLNPAFLEANNAVLLGCADGRLTVGMVEPGDQRLLEALRFATDLDVVAVRLSAEDIQLRPAMSAGEFSPGPSVVERIFRHFPLQSPEAAFAPLALLLQAGVEPREAGGLLLDADRRGPRLDDRARATAAALQRGVPLTEALEAGGEALAWASRFLAALPVSLDRSAIFARLVLRAPHLERIELQTRRLAWEIAVLGVLVLAAWSIAEPSALPALAVIAIIASAHAFRLRARCADSDAVRSAVLHIVGALAALPIAPALCIQAGLARVNGQDHTGRCCERSDLAAQLKLGIIDTAILGNMDLAAGAQQMADIFARRAEEACERFAWASRLVAGAALAAALLLLVM